MAATYKKAKITYDGDGELKLITRKGADTYSSIINENGEYFVRMSDDDWPGVIYAPETDNYAAAVLEFTV